jgi:DNA ligase-1
MKQGSIANFITKGKDKTKSDPVEGSKEVIESKLKSSHKDEKALTPKKQTVTKQNKSSEKKSQGAKRRHIVDDEEETQEVLNNQELAAELLIPLETKIEITSNVENKSNESIPFNLVCKALSEIENTKGQGSKDTMKGILSDLFENIILNSPEDLPRAYYFLLSKVGPEYKSPEFGIGSGTLEKVISKAIGKDPKYIKERMVSLGDLALVASEGKKTLGTMDKFSGFTSTENKKELSLKFVMDNFLTLANIKGKSSFADKEKLLVKLFFLANKDEIKYIVRSLEKSIKIGASLKTIIAALARTVCRFYNEDKSTCKLKSDKKVKKNLEEKEAERTMLIALNNLCDEDLVFHHLIEVISQRRDFADLIKLCEITPGVPVKPQLARPTNGIKVILQRFEGVPFTCEYKYDGFRGQVHHYTNKETVKTEIFSRNLENMSESYPDIIQFLDSNHSDKAKSFIIDCEIVAFDQKTGKILPFHNLTTRARKNVNVKEISTHVCMFLFDIFYLNGKNLCSLTLDERRKILQENFKEDHNIQFAKFVSSEKVEEIEEFMNEAINAGKKIFLNNFMKIELALVV